MPDDAHNSDKIHTKTLELELEAARQRAAELQSCLDRAEAERITLRESETRFKILSEMISDCCWARWKSADGTTERLWVNDAFETLTGYTPEEFESIGREGLLHPEDLEQALQYVDGPLGLSEHEFRIIRKDGRVRWLHERMSVHNEGEAMCVLGATQDVTERKEAEILLRNANHELEERVQQRTHELSQANTRLEAEVAQHRETQEQLLQAKENAEHANQAKSWFLANISHEIRTPLNGIIGMTQLLLRSELAPQEHKYVEVLRDSSEALLRLINDVLDFSKVEADSLSLETVDFRFHDVLNDIVRLFRPRAAAKSLGLGLKVDKALPDWLRGDPARLHQVLTNLLDNAIKFTESGEVSLTATVESRKDDTWLVRFAVADSGIGISAEEQKRLFQPFTQADETTTRRFGGTGLGLAISARLVTLMGGQIGIDSQPGQGSTFWFTTSFGSVQGSGARAEKAPVVEAHADAASGARILIAEDNPANQVVLSEQLAYMGHETELAINGVEVLTALESGTRFDMIVMDVHMPEMDGFETTRRIRQRADELGQIPILAVTADAATEALAQCRSVGMNEVITKPYRTAELAAMVKRILGR